MNSIIKKFDIIILTHKPKQYFVETLKKINTQVILPEKVIIYNTDENSFFDNIDREEYELIVKDLKYIYEVYHITKQDFDHGKTRNIASLKSNTPYLMFLTDDAVPFDEYLTKNLLSSFNDDKVALSYARQIPRDNSMLKERYIREFNYGDNDIIKDINTEKIYGIKNYFCSNVCSMYNKSIFELLGRFDENIILNEDTFFAYKAIRNGYKIVYKSNAKIIHSHDYTYIEQFKRNFDIGVSHIDKADIFNRLPAESEGKKLVFYVLGKLIKEFRILEAVDFINECIFRYLGFKDGKKYNSLGYKNCLKKTNNKQYFINKYNLGLK